MIKQWRVDSFERLDRVSMAFHQRHFIRLGLASITRYSIMTTKSIPVTTSSNELGWLSLSCDAGGASTHSGEVTFLGVTPDDLGLHDPDGTYLGWISLELVQTN